MNKNDLVNIVESEKERTINLRREERNLNSRELYLNSQPLVNIRNDLRANLRAGLPKKLVPRNVGSLDQVIWPYTYQFDFDFSSGADAVFPVATVESTRQVDNESAFLLCGLQRDFVENDSAGYSAPLEFTLRDRQSTRQFNDAPILWPHLGYRGAITKLSVPLLIMPNARITVEMRTFLSSDYTVLNRSGKVALVAHGYKIRKSDVAEIVDFMYA